MALEGHFYRTDGSDKNAREPVSEAQKRHDREIKAEMVRIRNREVVERTIAQNGIAAASIVAAVAHAHGISTADLTSRVRRRHITHARQHACALMRELTGLSLQDIANAINIVDHSTAHHSIITWRVRAAGYTKEDAVARQMLGVA
jgi:chromosomal replication initiation ATPase DnaA